jgi:hypothetical protein
MIMQRKTFLLLAAALGVLRAQAAEQDHSGHTAMPAAPAAVTTAPAETPPSGKGREAGYDGGDMMQSTTIENPLALQCAQAGRGLVALDRATLARCGEAPAAAPAAAPTAGHPHQH